MGFKILLAPIAVIARSSFKICMEKVIPLFFCGYLLQDLPSISFDSDSLPFDIAPDGRIFLSINPYTIMVFYGLNGFIGP